MPINKQAFYEGAALYMLARQARTIRLEYRNPFFIINAEVAVYLKYSARVRSPWTFTFGVAEFAALAETSCSSELVVGLICGGDGIAGVTYEQLHKIVGVPTSAAHVACARRYNEHYGVVGPQGELDKKVQPSW